MVRSYNSWRWLSRDAKRQLKRNFMVLFILALLLAPFNSFAAVAYADNNPDNNDIEMLNEDNDDGEAENVEAEADESDADEDELNEENDSSENEVDESNEGNDEENDQEAVPQNDADNDADLSEEPAATPKAMHKSLNDDGDNNSNQNMLKSKKKDDVSVHVQKEWIGPPADSVTIGLLENGVYKGKSMDLSADNNWQGQFDNLPKYSWFLFFKTEINYTVKELPLSGYHSERTGNAQDGYTFINTNTEKMNIPVEKEWVGPAAQIAVFKLLANGQDTGERLTLDKYKQWKGAFFNQYKYDQTSGEAIDYSVEEVGLDWYTTKVSGSAEDGYTFTNIAHETVNLLVEKLWNGKKTPITFNLLADGVETGDTLTFDGTDGWSGKFTDLRKYDDETGEEIIYDVDEVELVGYTTYKSVNRQGPEDRFSFTNMENIDIDVTKKWMGPEADSATFNLFTVNHHLVESMTLTEDDDWTGTFEGLQKYNYENGELVEYYVEEEAIPGYTTTVEGSNEEGYIFTNSSDATITANVYKYWYGDQAAEASFDLYADGEATGETLTLTEDDNWMGAFDDLPKYSTETGEKIVYTIEEVALDGYQTSESFYGHDEDNIFFSFYNTKVTDIDVTKVWEGEPGESATFHLVIDGEETDETLELTADDDWQGAFTGLPTVDVEANVEVPPVIEYDVVEAEIEGYEMTDKSGDANEGFVFTNTEITEEPPIEEDPPADEAEIGYISVEYRDIEGTNLIQPIILSGKIGEDYTTEEKSFAGYELDRIEGDTEGQFAEMADRVIYVYKPIEEGKTIVTIDKDDPSTSVSTTEGQALPKTATPYYTIGLAGLIILALGGLGVMIRRKKSI